MSFRIASVGIVALFVAVAAAGEDATEAELKKLHGTWHLHVVARIGGAQQSFDGPRGKLVFTQDKFEIWTLPDGKFKKASEGKYRINPKVFPKQLDFEDEKDGKKRVREFSYKLVGDRLIVGEGRLKTWKDEDLAEGVIILEYKRVKE